MLGGRVQGLCEQRLNARIGGLLIHQSDGGGVGQGILPEGPERRSIPVGAAQLGNARVEVAVNPNKAGE